MNHITKLCIVRVSREEYQDVWSAITMVRSIANISVAIYLLDLTGKPQKCFVIAAKLILLEIIGGHFSSFFHISLFRKSLSLIFFCGWWVVVLGSIKKCKNAALKFEELKFEQHKLLVGDHLPADSSKLMQDYLDRIKVLEH